MSKVKYIFLDIFYLLLFFFLRLECVFTCEHLTAPDLGADWVSVRTNYIEVTLSWPTTPATKEEKRSDVKFCSNIILSKANSVNKRKVPHTCK